MLNHSSLSCGHFSSVEYDNKIVDIGGWKETDEDIRPRRHHYASGQQDGNHEVANTLPIENAGVDRFCFDSRPRKHDDKVHSTTKPKVDEDKENRSLHSIESQLPGNSSDLQSANIVDGNRKSRVMDFSREYSIKDICIDGRESSQSPDKILLGNEELNAEKFIDVLQFESNKFSVSTGLKSNTLPISEDLRSLSFDLPLVSAKDTVRSPESIQTEEGNIDASIDNVDGLSCTKITLEELLLTGERRFSSDHFDPSASSKCGESNDSNQKQIEKSKEIVISPVTANRTNMEASTALCACVVLEKRSNEEHFSSCCEEGCGRMTSEIDSSSLVADERAKGADGADHQQLGRSMDALLNEHDAFSCRSGLTQCVSIHRGPVESSFHEESSLSGPLGSASFRSESSCTSAHSFAFPILNSEWNSSPVRMAKADRRRRHRGLWRRYVLCCRF